MLVREFPAVLPRLVSAVHKPEQRKGNGPGVQTTPARAITWIGVGILLAGGIAIYLQRGPAILLDVMSGSLGWLCL
jgi:hypothetical protein